MTAKPDPMRPHDQAGETDGSGPDASAGQGAKVGIGTALVGTTAGLMGVFALLFAITMVLIATSKTRNAARDHAEEVADRLGRAVSFARDPGQVQALLAQARVGSACLVHLDGAPWAADAALPWLEAAEDALREGRRLMRFDGGSYALAVRPLKRPGESANLIVAAPTGMPAVAATMRLGWLALAFAALFAAGMLLVRRVSVDLARGLLSVASAADRIAESGAALDGPSPRPDLDGEIGELNRRLEVVHQRFRDELEKYQSALAELEKEDRYKEEFLSTISHELRTPLNAIIGFADILLQNLEGELTQAQREDVRIIRQSGKHLLEMIEEILDLSALASGRLQLTVEPIRLVDVAREVIDAVRVQAVGKPLALVLDETADTGTVPADRRRVWQVMMNLVVNAVKFTEQGEVRVSVARAGDRLVVAVKDTGPGIPAKDQETIFEEYQQRGDQQIRRRGTGLGLAISKQLVALHGGDIWVDSTPGQGAAFFFSLPMERP